MHGVKNKEINALGFILMILIKLSNTRGGYMKKRGILHVICSDHPKMWRTIRENNLRALRRQFGYNSYSTVDSMSIDDVVSIVHLECIQEKKFEFRKPYDLDPPLELIVLRAPKAQVNMYRKVIIECITAYTNKAVINRTKTLYRRGKRLQPYPMDNEIQDFDDPYKMINNTDFIQLVSNFRSASEILEFLKNSKISMLEKNIMSYWFKDFEIKEIAKNLRVSKVKVYNTIKKVKKLILETLTMGKEE